ncbi:amidohydrolase family protein [Leifsonia sp. AG29]|uniref:amidohydrolase family protein n=1 Tax=Leifsonia sp. AG29 TaxID=2598860 RepID=UPI00131C4653|nr:amidohydrolase family protein [Leifsonia sp. AG29]
MNSGYAIRARTLVPSATGEAIAGGGVIIADGTIGQVGRFIDLPTEGLPVIDVPGTLMPGMIDAHSHLRGMPLDAHGIPQRRLESWLCSLAAMTPLSPADEARLAAAELLETGVTTVQGMAHSFDDPDAYRSMLADTAHGLRESGIRALVILGYSDRAERAPQPPRGAWSLIPEVSHRMDPAGFGALADAWLQAEQGGVPDWGAGPVASQWVSPDALDRLARLPAVSRLHTHLNESVHQRTWIAGDEPPVARLDRAGLLDSRLSAAHAVHLTDEELTVIAQRGVVLVHCPSSNRALGVGTARVAEWLRRGIPSALGIDSQNTAHPDMFSVMRDAVDSAAGIGDPIDETAVFALATTGGAEAVGRRELGRLEPGAPADLVALALETDPAAAVTEIVRLGTADSVATVWVGGVRRVSSGRSLLDTGEVRRRLQAHLDADAQRRAERLAVVAESVGIVEALLGEDDA